MAFDINGFKRVSTVGAIGNGPGSIKSQCAYCTNDDAAAVEATGYFNDLHADLAKGDTIQVSMDIDATPVLKNYIVTGIAAKVVTIAKQTA